jgi:hypothetical protein
MLELIKTQYSIEEQRARFVLMTESWPTWVLKVDSDGESVYESLGFRITIDKVKKEVKDIYDLTTETTLLVSDHARFIWMMALVEGELVKELRGTP